jgi:uncharacterized protein YutE (UPF0331/DUF86 family)
MSDARWVDVQDQIDRGLKHFGRAIRLYSQSTFDPEAEDGQDDAMALMHYMQLAHTAVENALLRVLRILGEEKPDGEDWHDALLSRLSTGMTGEHERPALLNAGLVEDLRETKNFRHRATRSYDDFNVAYAEPSMTAAKRLLESLPSLVDEMKALTDPDPTRTFS